MYTTHDLRPTGRLPMFQLPDVTVLLEACANPRFRPVVMDISGEERIRQNDLRCSGIVPTLLLTRQAEYLQRSLTHMGLLLQ